MFVTGCTKVESRNYEIYEEQTRSLKMTKTWFNKMLQQLQTARYDASIHQNIYGLKQNGRLFPAFDIHRHGLAAAYLLNRKSKGEMFSKVEEGDTCTREKTASENLRRITDGISDIKIVNKEVWRPLPRFQRTKKFPKEDLTADEDKKPLSSCTAYKLKSPKQRDTIPDKIEDLSATAEMDLTAKSCIESGAEFKVLFVPGYEVDKKAEFYEDPLKIGGLNVTSIKRASVNRQDPFISRVVALRKLDDETTATEDKQKRLENLLYPSRYNGAYRERKISIERRTITAKSPQCGSSADCQLKARGAPPTPSRRNRVTGGKKGFNSVEGIFDTAKSSHKRVVSDYKALTYVCDRTSSEDTDSLQGNEQSNNAMTKVSAKSPRRRRSKCGASPDSQTSQMFDATDVTAKYLVPCGEKIKDTGKRKRQNYSPGKSFFSQRKNSLTKPSNKRPATAEVRKKKTSTPKRPNTASVDTRKQASERV